MSNHRLQAMEWVLVNAYKIVNLTYLSIPSNYKHKSSSISIHLHMTNNPLIFSQKLQNSHKSVIHAWIKHTYTIHIHYCVYYLSNPIFILLFWQNCTFWLFSIYQYICTPTNKHTQMSAEKTYKTEPFLFIFMHVEWAQKLNELCKYTHKSNNNAAATTAIIPPTSVCVF